MMEAEMAPGTAGRKYTLEARLPAAVALGALGLYLAFPSARYNFDGVACAIAVELGDLRHLVHGNHLAYGFLGWTWFLAWKAFGYGGPALQCLQVLSSILGALAAGAFARALLRCGLRPLLAAAAAAGLAVSNAYWMWSVEAQVYPLGAIWLMLAFGEAVRETPDATRLGLFHAGAILGHVGHSMFAPAACWLLWEGRPGRDPRTLRRYASALAATVAAAYLVAGLCLVRPRSWDELRVWLLGSAALGVDRKFAWVGGYSPEGFLGWIRTTLRLFGGGSWGGVVALALAAAGARFSWKRRPRLAAACAVWLAGYALLFTSWHPTQPVYRVTDLAPLWLLIALAAESLESARPRRRWFSTWGSAAAVAGLGFLNLRGTALPDGNPARNPDLQRARWVSDRTPENAWIIVDNVDQVYIPYFAHRRPLNARYFGGREAALRERVDALWRAGEPVFAVPQALGAPWRAWIGRQRSREEGHREGETLLAVLPSDQKIK